MIQRPVRYLIPIFALLILVSLAITCSDPTDALYTITFDAQGGAKPDPSAMTVAYAKKYGQFPTTTRPGHTFKGWWTAVDGEGFQFITGDPVEITGDQTIYAYWIEESP
ncbi:MAG: InlB B-repeat-containing protein [Sphaerochaeta sp.]|nr:InlB B-repeat-containing protein [Sphaerochaeta sp.]